jgi:hypothetical protein
MPTIEITKEEAELLKGQLNHDHFDPSRSSQLIALTRNIEHQLERQAQRSATGYRAKTMADLVLPLKLAEIRAVAKAVRVDVNDECIRFTKADCLPGELNRTAAEEFLEHLKAIAVCI